MSKMSQIAMQLQEILDIYGSVDSIPPSIYKALVDELGLDYQTLIKWMIDVETTM